MCYHHHRAAAAVCFRKRELDKSRDSDHAYSSPGPYRPVLRTATVCFFVLCYRHWFNRVPGSSLGIACLPSALTLMLADLPLTLLGAPVGIGEARVTVSRRQDREPGGFPLGTGPHVAVRRPQVYEQKHRRVTATPKKLGNVTPPSSSPEGLFC